MSTNPISNLSAAQLREAADLRDQIEAMEARLQVLLSGGASTAPRAAAPAPRVSAPSAPAKKAEAPAAKQGKRALSPEALERIRAGQAKRWAKVRAAQGGVAAPKPPKNKPGRKPKAAASAPSAKTPKRKMSAEGRARIQAAVKARWARVAAAKAAANATAAGAPKKKNSGKRGKK